MIEPRHPPAPAGAVIAVRPAYLAGLTWSVRHAGLVVRGRLGTRAQLLPCVERTKPDVLFLDARLETRLGGLELVESGLVSETAVVLVAEDIDAELIQRTRAVGAAGFLVWPVTQLQLEVTVAAALGMQRKRQPDAQVQLRRVTAALHRIAEELADVGLQPPQVSSGPRLRPLPELATLTPREWDVLHGLVDHRRVPTMAKEMHISPHTVRNHLKAIFAKLAVRSQSELLEKVVDRG